MANATAAMNFSAQKIFPLLLRVPAGGATRAVCARQCEWTLLRKVNIMRERELYRKGAIP